MYLFPPLAEHTLRYPDYHCCLCSYPLVGGPLLHEEELSVVKIEYS